VVRHNYPLDLQGFSDFFTIYYKLKNGYKKTCLRNLSGSKRTCSSKENLIYLFVCAKLWAFLTVEMFKLFYKYLRFILK